MFNRGKISEKQKIYILTLLKISSSYGMMKEVSLVGRIRHENPTST